jgi:hypothetical protein
MTLAEISTGPNTDSVSSNSRGGVAGSRTSGRYGLSVCARMSTLQLLDRPHLMTAAALDVPDP